MAQVECGQVPEPESPHDGFAYVALQELVTRIAHHNTGKLLDDKAGYEVMKKVASDENRHHLFYRDMVTAALERSEEHTSELQSLMRSSNSVFCLKQTKSNGRFAPSHKRLHSRHKFSSHQHFTS